MCLTRNTENEPFVFKNSVEQKIIGVIIDNKPTPKSHVKSLPKKSRKRY